jgi:hypothetical protein
MASVAPTDIDGPIRVLVADVRSAADLGSDHGLPLHSDHAQATTPDSLMGAAQRAIADEEVAAAERALADALDIDEAFRPAHAL